MSNKVEYISGYEIPKRELTQEEATREVTFERFVEFHLEAGEDFLDTTGEGDAAIYGGWLLHKYPECSKDILDVMNKNRGYLEINTFLEVGGLYVDEGDGSEAYEKFYTDFSTFCNQTVHLKKRVNQVLIQLIEHYNEQK